MFLYYCHISNADFYSYAYFSSSKLIILCRILLHFLNRILLFILFHLHVYDLICIQPQLIEQSLCVSKRIRQFFLYVLQIIIAIAPLESFQEFSSLYHDGFSQILRGMKLIPIAAFLKSSYTINSFLLHHLLSVAIYRCKYSLKWSSHT